MPHGVLVNKPNQTNPKPTYKDATTIINWNKSLPRWEEIFKNFEVDIFLTLFPEASQRRGTMMIKCMST